MRWNNKTFPSLNVIKGEILPYISKVILKYYHYRSDPKLGPAIVSTRIILCIFHACTAILSLSWDSKIKEAVNHPIYGRFYNCGYSQILGCPNNWIIMSFLGDGTDEEIY